MRIAVFQGPFASAGVAANLERLGKLARDAAGRGAGLLVCPEMYLTGYAIGPAAVRRLAEPVDGPSAARAAEIAREAGLALLYGYPELGEDGRVYNAALLLDRQGRRLANHRKTHLYGALDRDAFAAGDGPPTVAELDGVRVGILICYDVEFPGERPAAGAGRAPSWWPCRRPTWCPSPSSPTRWCPTRAYENHLFLAYANRCGREGELDYVGRSCVVGPDGLDLARAGAGEELIVADLDLARLRGRAAAQHLSRRPPARALRAGSPHPGHAHDRLARPGHRRLRRPRARSPISARTSRSPTTTGSRIPQGLGALPADRHGTEVAIVGAGCRRHDRRLRADAAGPQARRLRGRPDRRPAALAAVRGCRGRRSPSWAACASRSPRPPSSTTSTASASRPGPFPNPLDAGARPAR